MNLDFDLYGIKNIEFGIGVDEAGYQKFYRVPVDSSIQKALQEMATATWNSMRDSSSNPEMYAPSEKYESSDYVYISLKDDLAKRIDGLHTAKNLPINSRDLNDPRKVYCYFARMNDNQGRKLTALRRATQFKGVIKCRLIRLQSDALKLIEDKVFKLDSDFDLLVDGSNVHILRPSAFEFACNLQEAVLAAVPANIREIQSDLSFVDLTGVQDYASKHPRAARLVASIRRQNQTKNIDKTALMSQCSANGVGTAEVDGKIKVQAGHVLGFLEVLDRRRYKVELVKDSSERFKASARKRIK